MKKIFFISFIVAIFFLTLLAQSKYVGSKVCSSCHNQGAIKMYDLWKNSKHRLAYKILVEHSAKKAAKIEDVELWIVQMGNGKNYGLPTSAKESKYCLPCHITAYGINTKDISQSLDKEDGIQCESCHGPGSSHVELQRIKTIGKSIPANEIDRFIGLVKTDEFRQFKDENSIKAECETCHNGTCGDFNFNKMWPEIKHNISKN